MRKRINVYFLPVLFVIFVPFGLISQGSHAGMVPEHLQVCTDRTMFISGEKIFFSAVLLSVTTKDAIALSRIMYCELITPGGNQIAGGKYAVENSTAQGCLQIPEETITGIYYLKSYTRYMRNGSPGDYCYIMLKIINPYRADLLTGLQDKDTSSGSQVLMEGPTEDQSLIVSSDKFKYSCREDINLTLNADAQRRKFMKLCLTVIPEMAYKENTLPGNKLINYSYDIQYYTETRGISLTGKLLENESGLPIPNAVINLSIIGDKDVMAIQTDSAGRFFFPLPAYIGKRDIFLSADHFRNSAPTIFIENDFCPKTVKLPSPEFHLTDKEKATAYHLAVNQKLSSIFLKDTLPVENSASPPDEMPFYGEPTDILVVEKYIDLPTIEEYFNELPVEVKIRKNQGTKHFRFYTTRTDMDIYDPLVLIDWVAVDDIDRVLAMSPKEIDRIELVNSPYVKGNITYGGIISFVSKNNDFAGIDLPNSGTFINYKFLEDCSGNKISSPLPGNIPDSRNTVYWNPDVQTDDAGSAKISFTAPDTPGKYIILLRGMDNSGEMVFVRREFEVVANN